MLKELGDNVTLEDIKEYLWKTLKSGQVVPGLVANVFPWKVPTMNNCQLWARCLAQVRSALHRTPGILRHSARLAEEPYDPTREKGAIDCQPTSFRDSTLTIIMRQTYEVAPGVLTEHGKVSRRTYTKLCGASS